MTARFSLIPPGNSRGHRPRLQMLKILLDRFHQPANRRLCRHDIWFQSQQMSSLASYRANDGKSGSGGKYMQVFRYRGGTRKNDAVDSLGFEDFPDIARHRLNRPIDSSDILDRAAPPQFFGKHLSSDFRSWKQDSGADKALGERLQ